MSAADLFIESIKDNIEDAERIDDCWEKTEISLGKHTGYQQMNNFNDFANFSIGGSSHNYDAISKDINDIKRDISYIKLTMNKLLNAFEEKNEFTE